MKIKIVSDFHTEFWQQGNPPKFAKLMDKYFPACADDKDTVLVCAGDMGTYGSYANSYKLLLECFAKRFKHVIIVPGNHSYYNTAGIWRHEGKFWSDKRKHRNVSYLDNDIKVIGDVAFIGSCLWTSFNDRDPLAMHHAEKSMNDYLCVKKREYEVVETYGTVINSSKLTPEDTVEKHYESVAFIHQALDMFRDMKCVVVTHHLPTELSVHEKYRGDLLNGAFFTELSDTITTYAPTLWVHGHTHDSQDYMLMDTRIICNPLGYHAVQMNNKFNPDLSVEI